MKTVQVEELSLEGFLPFGFYVQHIDPEGERIGEPPIEFFRDMVQQDLGGSSIASFSTCRVEKNHIRLTLPKLLIYQMIQITG